MGLESLLRPVKWVDEQILREYTKLATTWEEKVGSRYLLALGLTCGGYFAIKLHIHDPEVVHQFEAAGFWENLPAYGCVGAYVTLLFHDILHTTHSITKNNSGSSGLIAEDKFNYVSQKIQRATRLPLLAVGMEGCYEFAGSIVNSQNILWASLTVGSAFLGLASSMYVKDSNPKLLDKQPFWKTAYDWIKSKTSATPQPVPVRAFSTIENYTQQN